jgi:ferrochelatase
MKRTGVLLINLGTPDAPTPPAVGKYLREFLMDGFVIDLKPVQRWFLVNLLIVPRRKHQSARLYQKIHTEKGSPLLVHTRNLTAHVAAELARLDDQFQVEFAMRYGNPSIRSTLKKLYSAKVERIIVAPLYPQYAESSFETAVVETKRRASELGCADLLSFLAPFYHRPQFISACAQRVVENFDRDSQHLLFSFHSLPIKHIQRLDHSRGHCLVGSDCCEQIGEVNRNCYRAQCVSTARAIANELGLTRDAYTISFQSRLGRAKWLEPASEKVINELAVNGHKRLAVFCPSFVADCLETLEEIAIRGRKTFIDAGGESLELIPALNTHPLWVRALSNWITEAAAGSPVPRPDHVTCEHCNDRGSYAHRSHLHHVAVIDSDGI